MSSEVKANKLSPATGTALQISDSGDTTTIPSGTTLAITSGATIANSGTASGFGLFSSYAILAHREAQNTAGGTCTLGAWRTRPLNTEFADPDSIVSIASDQFTLAAGTYFIKWRSEDYNIGNSATRLYNATDAALAESGFSSAPNKPRAGAGVARITITGSKAFEIQLYSAGTQATNGFGYPANFGPEQYCTVEIFKEA